jgi:hypothetical protein
MRASLEREYERELGYRRMRKLIKQLIFALLFLLPGTVSALSDVMLFQAYAPGETSKLFMNDYAWKIFASGDINEDAGKRLAALIAEKNIPAGSRLYLHSPGGSLLGGMALGRVIREHHLQTLIGQRDPSLNYVGGKAGYCYSACATAFLGGEFRYWTDGSVYGVHRFFWESHSTDDAAVAQIVSAALIEYIRSMGVDTEIFTLASQAGATDVITPSHETLLALNVVNDGRKPPTWTIESMPQGIYLKGAQETDNGVNKFMIVCTPGESTMFLYAIFDGGNNATRDIGWPINWLFLDHSPIRFERQMVSKDVKNGMFNLVYRLDSNLVTAISKAKFVGVGLQPTAQAKVFLGFDSMPFGGGAAKLPGLTSVCGRDHKTH